MVKNLKEQGTKAFLWDFGGKLSMHGMGFVVSIFLARLLEPADFGLIAMVMVFIGIAGIFGDVGLGSALIQRRKVLPIHYTSVFYFNIFAGSLLAILTFLLAPLISAFYNNEALTLLTQVVSVTFIINAFSSVQRTKLRKELNYALLSKVGFIVSLLSGIVGISLAFYGAGVWSLVIQSLIQGVLFNTIIWVKSDWKPSVSFSWKALTQLWAYGFRMFLSGLLDAIFSRLDTLIIGKIFEPATLGFFNRAKSLDKMVVKYSSGSLMSVLFPILSRVQKDLPRFQNIVIKSLGIIVFVVFFLLGGLYLVSQELVVLLFGAKWLQTTVYFKILLLSGFGYPVSAVLVNILSSRGNSKVFLRLEIFKKILFGTNLVVGFMWGIEGYLYGLCIAMSVAVIINMIFASREVDLPVRTFLSPLVKQASITIFSVLIIFHFIQFNNSSDIMSLVSKGILFSILYVFINWILKIDSYIYFLEQGSTVLLKIRQRIKYGK